MTRGRLVPGRRTAPPAPLPLVEVPPLPISSVGLSIDQIVRRLLLAYKEAGRGENMHRLTDYATTRWWGLVREMAVLLLEEGLSPTYYVRFVCRELGQKRGRFPWPSEVFSMKSIRGWLPVYRKAWAIPIPTHATTEERRTQYAEQVRARLRAH